MAKVLTTATVLALSVFAAPPITLGAAELGEAQVTRIIQDVQLLPQRTAPRPAALEDVVRGGTAVRTGTESRTELTFPDQTLARIGANTLFSFNRGTRSVDLGGGAMLLHVPKGAGGAKILTVAVTAAITGTTVLIEYHPPEGARGVKDFSKPAGGGKNIAFGLIRRDSGAGDLSSNYIKFITLEGVAHIYIKNQPGRPILVPAGKMLVIAPDGSWYNLLNVNLEVLVNTSPLITDFPPLPSYPQIVDEIQRQREEEIAGRLIDTNLVNYAGGQPVTLRDPSPLDTLDQRFAAVPPPSATPSKFGRPSTITSPNPYVITSGTTITTDPSITTNSVTDFGKIYRGSADDGAFSLWAFRSTSAFDTALKIDTEFFADPNHLPIAAFKFQSLSLNGNPTIDLSNGGVTKLALIGVDGITSGPPGGVLTFTGLDLLFLATVNGSINLTSDVSFQNINELAIYARGAGANLILNSPIFNIGILELAAEGSMSVGEFDATTRNNLTLQIGGSLSFNSATGLSRLRVRNEGAHIGTGGNINANIGGNLTAMSDFEAVIQNTSGQIDNGGNISLSVGSINVAGALTLLLQNYDGSGNPAGHIGNGGNISVTTRGDLAANSIDAEINNRNRGVIGSSAEVNFVIGGTLTTQGDATFGITNRNDGSGGGVINGAVTIDLTAANVSIGGGLSTDISTNRGGHIASAFNHVSVGTTMMAQSYLDFEIENEGFLLNNTFLHGGTIDSDAIIEVRAANMSTGTDYFSALIGNDGGGHIGGNAMINVVASGGINVATDAFFNITNNQSDQGPPAGTIGGDAAINVAAANISTGGGLFGLIDNSGGGSIGSNADLAFSLTRNLTARGEATFIIDNSNGGTIGGNAAITMSADNINTDRNFGADIENGNGNVAAGHITMGANVNLTVGGNLTTGSGGFGLSIENQPGTIGADVNIVASIGGNVTSQFAEAVISNTGGSIGSNADITTNIMGDLTTGTNTGTAFFGIYNFGGGTIGSNADVTINIRGDLVVASDADFFIWNYGLAQGSASIGQNAVVNANVTGDLNTQGALTLEILNYNGGGSAGGTIAGNATIDLTASNIAANTLTAQIYNYNNSSSDGTFGGRIGGDATINVNAANITANSLLVQIDNTGGSIGASTEGRAMINMNVSNSATVTNDATVAIYGSDGAAMGAAININGGNYNVGGTFLSSIDGNGTITFSNASAHADMLKVGVFGSNGVLNIGGGTLSADTTLKLYAPGSNGQLNFISNVTLGGAGAKILAANSVTIFNNVVVTIGGSTPADVYTNNANYSGFGGNGSTTGTFFGAGANNPQPLANRPPFGVPPVAPPPNHPSSPAGSRPPGRAMYIDSSTQLLTLLDSTSAGPNGRVVVDPRGTQNARTSDPGGRNGRALLAAERAETRERRPLGGIQLQ